MSFQKDSDEFKMFGDFYNLVKKHWNGDGSPASCEDALNDTELFMKAWEKSDRKTRVMSGELASAFIKFCDKIYSHRKI